MLVFFLPSNIVLLQFFNQSSCVIGRQLRGNLPNNSLQLEKHLHRSATYFIDTVSHLCQFFGFVIQSVTFFLQKNFIFIDPSDGFPSLLLDTDEEIHRHGQCFAVEEDESIGEIHSMCPCVDRVHCIGGESNRNEKRFVHFSSDRSERDTEREGERTCNMQKTTRSCYCLPATSFHPFERTSISLKRRNSASFYLQKETMTTMEEPSHQCQGSIV